MFVFYWLSIIYLLHIRVSYLHIMQMVWRCWRVPSLEIIKCSKVSSSRWQLVSQVTQVLDPNQSDILGGIEHHAIFHAEGLENFQGHAVPPTRQGWNWSGKGLREDFGSWMLAFDFCHAYLHRSHNFHLAIVSSYCYISLMLSDSPWLNAGGFGATWVRHYNRICMWPWHNLHFGIWQCKHGTKKNTTHSKE